MPTLVDHFGREIDLRRYTADRRADQRQRRADSLSASYDAAAVTQETAKHWRYSDSYSAAAANSASVRKTLRQRSRYEILENNSFGKGIALTLANDTISTGPSLQVMLPDSSASRVIEQRWRKWCKDVRLADKLRTARLAKIIDGEAVILKGTNRRSRNDVKLDLRVIECDMLSTPNYMDGMPNRVDGILFDDFGNPTEYHVLKGHPGDLLAWKAWDYESVSPDDLIHLFRVERPGQQRGIPEMTPALPLFAQLRRYTLAVITAAENAAAMSAVLKTQASAFDSMSDGIDDVEPFDFVQIDRGMMVSLPRGWDMSQFKPEQPTTTYEGFRNAILNEIARSVHMPSNKALADSSKYNYSSGRLDHQTYYEAISVERSQWEIQCLDRIFEWWLDEAFMLSGYLPAIEPMDEIPHVWRWPPNRDVDPKDVADANIALINAGLKTRQMYLIEQNIDPESHMQQLAEEGWQDPNAIEVAPVEPAPDTPPDSNSLTQIVAAVAAGTMPHDTAKVVIAAAFPAMDARTIDEMIDPIEAAPTPADPSLNADPSAPAADGEPAATPPPGEFANLSRQQLKRQMAAIDDGLNKVASGEWNIARARVFYGSIGLTEKTIDNLLSEYESIGEVPTPEVQAANCFQNDLLLADGWVTKKDTDQRLYIEDGELKTKPGGKQLKTKSGKTKTDNDGAAPADRSNQQATPQTAKRVSVSHSDVMREHEPALEKFRKNLIEAEARTQARVDKALANWEKKEAAVQLKHAEIKELKRDMIMYDEALQRDPTNIVLQQRRENASLAMQIRNVELSQLQAEEDRATKAYHKASKQRRNAVSDALANECKAVDVEDGLTAADRRQSVKQIEDVHSSGRHIEQYAADKINGAEIVAQANAVFPKLIRNEAESFLRNTVNPTIHAEALTVPIDYRDEHTRASAYGLRYVGVDQDGNTFSSSKISGEHIRANVSTSASTFVHEYGHCIEFGNQEASDLAISFLDARKSGQDDVQFNQTSWGKEYDYNDSEKGSPDDFARVSAAVYGGQEGDNENIARAHYIGKTYDGAENYASQQIAGKTINYSRIRSTEVLSMGMQMLYDNPVAFAKADPEYFNLISGIASGRLLTKTRESRRR